jgi:hypothetical protein
MLTFENDREIVRKAMSIFDETTGRLLHV